MKKWILFCLMALLLVGCSKESGPVDRPYSLEVVYGESSVYAMTGGYGWNWKEGRKTESVTADAADPRQTLERLSYLNAGKDVSLQLHFEQEPDKLLVERYSNVDGYASATVEEVNGNAIPAPLDGNDHLYSVTAVWLEERDSDRWGSCSYDFRFLAHGVAASTTPTMPDYGDLDLYEVVRLDPSAIMGIEFINHVDGLNKTCRTQKDKAAILGFLQENLTIEFTPSPVAAPEADYMLRLVCVDGTQMTIGYGADGAQSWLLVGGVAYEAGAMDMAALWTGLEAGTISQAAAESGKHYLSMSDVFPGADWGDQFVYGYLTGLDTQAAYDEMRWIDDSAEPNGYRLEKGWAGQSKAVAADCEYWILDEHQAPWCQVSAADLWSWSQEAGSDVLFQIFVKDDQIVAICEKFVP